MTDEDVAAAAVPVVRRGIMCLPMLRDLAELACSVIERYPADLRAAVETAQIRTVLIGPFQRYGDYSPLLARTDVDQRDVPPSGIFVAPERALYVRVPRTMVVAHEYAHAIDFALGDGRKPFCRRERAVGRAFRAATRRMKFITRYSAAGLEEYLAEGLRAMVGVNDPDSTWPPVSPEVLQDVDPALHAVLERIWTWPFG